MVMHLLSLDEDMLLMVARHVLMMDLPAALQLSATCKILNSKLGVICKEAGARRLRWVDKDLARHTVSSDGLTLVKVGAASDNEWTTGPLLPTSGCSKWCVRVDQSWRNLGLLNIGVCDAATLNAWSLNLSDGRLIRSRRDETGAALTVTIAEDVLEFPRQPAPPTHGFPDGSLKQVLFDAEGKPGHLRGKANGAIIETCLDHDKGTLSFGINGGPLQRALGGFPVGAAMRPHAFLPGSGHRVSFTCPYVQHALPAGRLTDMVLP